MLEHIVTYAKLTAKGTPVSVRVLSPPLWQKLIELHPDVPRNFRQLRRLGHRIFNVKPTPAPGLAPAPPPEHKAQILPGHAPDHPCGAGLMELFIQGVANPGISDAEHQSLDEELAAEVPPLPNHISTAHFDLYWTENDPDPRNNISGVIVDETAEYLETAWSSYTTTFGRAPYIANGQAKIQVQFYDLGDSLYGTTTAQGPIKLNSYKWNEIPGIRKPTSAHELFHREQYSFGLSTKYQPPLPRDWFIEGTANWGSVFVWQSVAGVNAITALFSNPNQSLFDAGYYALPFWIFVEGMQSDAYDNAMVELWRQFDRQGDIMDALETTFELGWGNAMPYSTFDFNFMLFNWARINNLWREKRTGVFSAGPLYPVIDGPDGTPITPQLTINTRALSRDQSYSTADTVEQYGTQYYQVDLGGNTNGVGLYELTRVDAVKYLYTVTRMLQGQVVIADAVNILQLVQGDLDVMYGIGLSYNDQFVFTVSSNLGGTNAYQIYLSPTNRPNPPWE